MNPGIDIDGSAMGASDYDALADLFLSEESPRVVVKKESLQNVRVRPAPAGAPHPAGVRLVRDEPEESAPAPVAGAALPQIEGVLVGHLPVLASAWVTQYARYQADTSREPVALLRLQGGQVWIDVVLPGGSRPQASPAAKPGESLKLVTQHAARTWRRWMVRVDKDAEAELLSTQSLASVTLLTGADDAAVVASYQQIKALGNVAAHEAGATNLRLVIMGAADAKAGDAEQALRRAAGTFLGRSIESAVRVGKIGSSMAVPVFRGAADTGVSDLLALIAATPTAAAPARPAPAPITIPTVSAPAPEPTPVVAVRPTRPEHVSLAARVPGLNALGLDCPYAKGVELATGADGRLHLVAGAGANGSSLGVSDAAQRLLTGAAWANDHAKLLRAACPALKDVEPVLHVVTANAKEARGLLDTGMRLHLLSRVEVGGAVGWAVADLN